MTKKLNDGVKKVTPDRDLNIIKVHFPNLDITVVFMGTHWVSGKDNKLRFRRKLRKKLWRWDWEVTRDIVNHFNEQGLWVVIAGDINEEDPKEFNDRMIWHFPGIMKVGISPPVENKDNVFIKIEDDSKITNVFTDKPFRVIDLNIYKK
jgi:hypothetical protein